jgi:hypothetical protein
VVEREPEELSVGGSIPSPGTILLPIFFKKFVTNRFNNKPNLIYKKIPYILVEK